MVFGSERAVVRGRESAVVGGRVGVSARGREGAVATGNNMEGGNAINKSVYKYNNGASSTELTPGIIKTSQVREKGGGK